jgi:hypothetical protein
VKQGSAVRAALELVGAAKLLVLATVVSLVTAAAARDFDNDKICQAPKNTHSYVEKRFACSKTCHRPLQSSSRMTQHGLDTWASAKRE